MYYPLFLDLTDQPVLIVGAGRIATRKAQALLAAGAHITLVSPFASPTLQRWARAGRLSWRPRRYRPTDLSGVRLVIAATDDPIVNQQVCRDAHRRRLLVNCVAPPEAGNYIVPSVIRRGALTLAISTGGASPSLAKAMRLRLEKFLRANREDPELIALRRRVKRCPLSVGNASGTIAPSNSSRRRTDHRRLTGRKAS